MTKTLLATSLVVIGLITATMVFSISRPANAAISAIAYGQSCFGGKSRVSFAWFGADVSTIESWLDIGLREDFAVDSFESHGPFRGRSTTPQPVSLEPGSNYFVRVNEKLADGSWQPSVPTEFVTACGNRQLPAGATVAVLGFADRDSATWVEPGGTLRACNTDRLNIRVAVSGLDQITSFNVLWFNPTVNRNFDAAFAPGDSTRTITTFVPAPGLREGTYRFILTAEGFRLESRISVVC